MRYQDFEFYITEKPPVDPKKLAGDLAENHKVLCCEIYHATDEDMANPLSVFDLVEGIDFPDLSEETAVQTVQDYISKNYTDLLDKAALSMDRFLKINGAVFSFEQVAKALGLQLSANESVKIDLCQRVNGGILVAQGAPFDNDDYPGLDVFMELPPEKGSFPVMITRTEQPRPEEEVHSVRTYAYSRSDEYFMYFDVDTRSDEEVDKDFSIPQVVVSGGPHYPVEVVSENSYFRYCGKLAPITRKASLDEKIQGAASQITSLKSSHELHKEDLDICK